ncbi:hypothetical protein UFOVP1033_44 [uncultured Caudovirales phage]|uniref:Uncharacterized protein n=1 Tax=uncultured Caudovirales phage TaxID=2100421 RepID=A0A6J5Q4J3_9CAUD|nr:hypothetical protein UFOVP1033_44 [uncultured Caudovirales phage]CAB4220627.1 hypothetical protein UFOVP1631_44 [uncultured Caudovirales phage]
MTDLLITIIISGVAVTYVIEFLELITTGIIGISLLNKFLTLPLSIGALISQNSTGMQLVVAAPATATVALLLSKYLNKPRAVQRTPRV